MIFFIASYWFNKIMLMRYYQKTYEFNEILPIKSMRLLKLAYFMHVIAGFYIIYTNKSFITSHLESVHSNHLNYHTKPQNNDKNANIFQRTDLIIFLVPQIIIFLLIFIDYFIYGFSNELMIKIIMKMTKRSLNGK